MGIDVNRAARIAAAGHGGQILLSETTRSLVEHDLPTGVAIRDLGPHRLKDIDHPENLFDLLIEGLPSDFPPPAALDARPTNLPQQLTSFVGRRGEIDETIRQLTEHRLVTLTGPGGTGKTRLALEVAATLLPSFADGAFFVDLAPLSDPGQVCPAICGALGVREEAGGDLVEMLVGRLSGKTLLLVLDNFEHVVTEARLIGDVLARVPEVRFLATSRVPLGLYGEQELAVPPLSVPRAASDTDLEALQRYEAVALFVDRARAARPDFGLTVENAPAVAELCARLDGLPLAVELAASRIKVLGPEAIRSRLGEGLDVLEARAANIPDRQRTLRATIAWSEGLLEEPERRLFARLAVFAGGADLDAVAAVAGLDSSADVLEGLSTLVDHSLIGQSVTGGGEPRFDMLGTIREYARERLEAEGDLEATRRRHGEHFLNLAETAEPRLTTDDQVPWLDRLDRDHENIQAALGWALEAGEVDRACAAAAAMWRFWQLRGHLSIGRAWLDRVLAVPGSRSAARARAHGAAGSLAYWLRHVEETEHHYGEALAIAEELGDRRGIAEARYNLAFVPYIRGSGYEEAMRSLRQAAELFEELGDEERAATARGDVSFFLMLSGDHRAALPILEDAVARSRRQGDLFHLVDNLMRMAQTHIVLEDHAAARAACMEALEVLERGRITGGIAAVLQMLSASEAALGRYERAMRLYGAAAAMNEAISEDELSGLGDDPVEPTRKAIGDEATDRALVEGRVMSVDEALAYARSADD